jgi:hypothetical protein
LKPKGNKSPIIIRASSKEGVEPGVINNNQNANLSHQPITLLPLLNPLTLKPILWGVG